MECERLRDERRLGLAWGRSAKNPRRAHIAGLSISKTHAFHSYLYLAVSLLKWNTILVWMEVFYYLPCINDTLLDYLTSSKSSPQAFLSMSLSCLILIKAVFLELSFLYTHYNFQVAMMSSYTLGGKSYNIYSR